MGEVDHPDWSQVAEAVVVWSGWGSSAWPTRLDDAVVRRYGAEEAATLLPLVHELVSEFYASEACYRAADLTEMVDMAREDFTARRPGVPEEAIRALAWCYTFDHK